MFIVVCVDSTMWRIFLRIDGCLARVTVIKAATAYASLS